MRRKTVLLCMLVGFAVGSSSARVTISGDKRELAPDLAGLASGKGGRVVNRSVSAIQDGNFKAIRFDERPGDGLAWLDGIDLGDGTIDVDVKGKNVVQRSFVGIAFHGVDDTTYDAVYFRPFNFKSDDPARRAHSVQYVSHPQYTWHRLRNEHPGIYEKAVTPVPDPDGWFHARIVLAGQKVSVFVNGSKEPSLTVDLLNDRRRGSLGLWVGNGSGGDLANLKVKG